MRRAKFGEFHKIAEIQVTPFREQGIITTQSQAFGKKLQKVVRDIPVIGKANRFPLGAKFHTL